MSYANEFATVDILLESKSETRGVDAFALSLIKAERQMRRLVTFLVYQFPCFLQGDAEQLRDALGRNNDVYFPELERGFDALYPRKVRDLVGSDYRKLRRRLCDAERHRNKIFHGQLTAEYLSRQELTSYVCDIRSWCQALASACMAEFRYDGFGRNSFQKSAIPNVSSRFRIQMAGLPDYEKFIRKHLERHKRSRRRAIAAS
jgi:hypothetical protein